MHPHQKMLSHPLSNITTAIKLAREFALLGNYETALVTWEGVDSTISSHLRGVHNSIARKKWTKLQTVRMFGFVEIHYSNSAENSSY